MKKFILSLIFVMAFATFGVAQSSKSIIHTLADTSKYFTNPLSVGDFVYNQATYKWYVSKVTVSVTAHKKLSWLLASTARYTYPNTNVWASSDTNANKKLAAYYTTMTAIALKAAKSDTGSNGKNAAYYDMTTKLALKSNSVSPTFTGTVVAPVITNATRLAGGRITGTSSSITADSCTTLVASSNVSVGGVIFGNALCRDSVVFTSTATRVSKAIAGATNASIYVVTQRALTDHNSTSRPVAGDLVNVYPKTDSVVFNRAVNTSSTATYYFIRIK